MKIHELRPKKGSTSRKKRLGRGIASGKGRTAGRGDKGQKSRSGFKIKRGFEGGQTPLVTRLPKRRGVGNRPLPWTRFQIINLRDLAVFEEGAEINKKELIKKGLINKKGKVKLLGDGEVSKKLIIQIDAVSKNAREKIEKAGGRIK